MARRHDTEPPASPETLSQPSTVPDDNSEYDPAQTVTGQLAAAAAAGTPPANEPKRNTSLTASEAVRLMLATLKRVPLDKQAKVLSSLAVLAELDQ